MKKGVNTKAPASKTNHALEPVCLMLQSQSTYH